MSKRLIHTPEGVRDIYGLEYAKKIKVQDLLHQNFKLFGFQDILTPTFEFFDVFGSEIGTTPSKELYKFFDKEGNTLVLRPDFTPSMARCAAKYFVDTNIPVRLTYAGNTFTNTSNLQGKLKEVTQTGVELIGDDSVAADAELINLAVEALRCSGLREFQVSIGEIEYFKGICEEFGLNDETEVELREFISNKNYFGAEELLESKQISKDKITAILKVTELFGSYETLQLAKQYVTNARSIQAIKRLEAVYETLCVYGVEQYVSFDLGMISMYHYYTGIVFKAYTYGVGDAVLTGGRYDGLLSYFGKNTPAIGFVIVVDDLMVALTSQKISLGDFSQLTLLVYKKEFFKEVLQKAKQMREAGELVEMIPLEEQVTKETYLEYASNRQVKTFYYVDSLEVLN